MVSQIRIVRPWSRGHFMVIMITSQADKGIDGGAPVCPDTASTVAGTGRIVQKASPPREYSR